MEGSISAPLSLKVMRVSRPTLASQWQPFFSSSPSFSAHATADVLSLQGEEPLPGHPKTLRDLTHAGQMLTLPTSFGAIQLGETFSCCLCVNNDSSAKVYGATAKIEMQTASNKVLLDEIGGLEYVIEPSGVIETVVTHEVKELGQHVLACTVSYRPPLPPGSTPNPLQDQLQTFRKYYKFAVTNPISVKTKVHAPSSPSALLSREEREKLFMEVQIQNLMQNPLWVERIRLIPTEGWAVENQDSQQTGDATQMNYPAQNIGEGAVFSGDMALMHAQDVRQYIYILTPLPSPDEPRCVQPTLPPGTITPLGRLDIVWRSSMGEPGRLITSPLTRRIPINPPPPVSSHVSGNIGIATTYRQRTQTQMSGTSSGPPSRSQSPHPSAQLRSYQHPSLQRVASPPPRPPSSLRRDSTASARPSSPKPRLTQESYSEPPEISIPDSKAPSVNVDLTIIKAVNNARAKLLEPFDLTFELVIAGTLPSQPQRTEKNQGATLSTDNPLVRTVRLAVQHILQPKTTNTVMSKGNTGGISVDNLILEDAFTPWIGSAIRSGYHTPRSTDVQSIPSPLSAGSASTSTLIGLPGRSTTVAKLRDGLPESHQGPLNLQRDGRFSKSALLPSPYAHPLSARKTRADATGSIAPVGNSLLVLPPLTLKPHTHSHTALPMTSGNSANLSDQHITHGSARTEFSLSYIPTAQGFAEISGLRVMMVGEWEAKEGAEGDDTSRDDVSESPAHILRVWDVLGEVWVQ